MIKLMDGVSINTKMEQLMKVNGKKINNMVLEKRSGQIVHNMKGIILRVKNMEKGSYNLQINRCMKEIFI
jgi:hypothetical protein